MDVPRRFIYAGSEHLTSEKDVPAPLFRRVFQADKPEKLTLRIAVAGFYELYANGEKLTRGFLAPYISAPDDFIFYDEYEIAAHAGENVIGVILGNGFQNEPGGYVWDFDKTPWLGAPRFALSLYNGDEMILESDEAFKCAPSPILSDDYRWGEEYDARLEIPGWNAPGFDDSSWKSAQLCESPRGEIVSNACDPLMIAQEIKPVSIVREPEGWRYDFGVNTAGVCRLRIRGEKGQKIVLYHGELIENGLLNLRNIKFREDDRVQRDTYILKGEGEEIYVPRFVYHGFRYVLAKGLNDNQATEDLLTYLEIHSALPERGGFACSDDTANKIQEITRRSDLSNFLYFPTDCPQREKNGWTGDASLSCEHILLYFGAERSYIQWLRCIRASQDARGALPGIVPTGGWGFKWGNGPGWDCVLFNLVYFIYQYRDSKDLIIDNAASMLRYLQYAGTRLDRDGLMEIGLGDWCPVGRGADEYKSPLRFTDSVITYDIAEKAAFLFSEIGFTREAAFASSLRDDLRAAIRKHLIDPRTLIAAGSCQTSQAMALFYGLFNKDEEEKAFPRLLAFIRQQKEHMDVGVFGARVIFHVLSRFNESDLAYRMIARPDYPSYGDWVRRGATSLWEMMQPEGTPCGSYNHHFWGDVSGWFIQAVAGIRVNPNRENPARVDIKPAFISDLSFAEGFHILPAGKVSARWERTENGVLLTVAAPDGVNGAIFAPKEYSFSGGKTEMPLRSGAYLLQA